MITASTRTSRAGTVRTKVLQEGHAQAGGGVHTLTTPALGPSHLAKS